MKPIGKGLLLGAAILLAAGCGVSKDQYTRLESQNAQLQESLGRLQKMTEALTRENNKLRSENQELLNENARLRQAREERKRGASGEGGTPPDAIAISEDELK